jgi:hypothetical protein
MHGVEARRRSVEATAGIAEESSGDQTVMNVSISAVVRDLDTTASGVQSAGSARRYCSRRCSR